jgi:hypothetical protein
MILHGRFENGVVVLQEGVSLPDGSEVTVIVPATGPAPAKCDARVMLPLVPSGAPGSLKLSSEKIAELLNRDDLSS